MKNRKQCVIILTILGYALVGCAGGQTASTVTQGSVISPQQEGRPMVTDARSAALYKQLHAQIDARTRALLKPGTKVYYLPTFTVNDRGNLEAFQGDATITRTTTGIIVTPADGTSITFSPSARITYLAQGGKAFVAPGRPVPSFLKGRTPDEVIK